MQAVRLATAGVKATKVSYALVTAVPELAAARACMPELFAFQSAVKSSGGIMLADAFVPPTQTSQSAWAWFAEKCSNGFKALGGYIIQGFAAFLTLPWYGQMVVGVVVCVVMGGIVKYIFFRTTPTPRAILPLGGTPVGNVPDGKELCCPISCERFVDPVMTVDGHSYERMYIATWFAGGHRTSPLTGAVLPSLELMPNHAMRNLVEGLP